MAYNPNQPRVPAGSASGGQWDGGSGGGARVNANLREMGVVNARGELSPQTRALWQKKFDTYMQRGARSMQESQHFRRLAKILGHEI